MKSSFKFFLILSLIGILGIGFVIIPKWEHKSNLQSATINTTNCPAGQARAIEQYGITWTLDKCYTYGQFANGDYWVVGPVTITKIDPEVVVVRYPDTQKLRYVSNGSMINPIVAPGTENDGLGQGYHYDENKNSPPYDANLNIGLQLPKVVNTNSSVVSTMRNPEQWITNADGSVNLEKTEWVFFKEIAILTVLPAAAPEGSFRPPYAGTNKTIKWNKSNIDYSKLKSIAIPNISNAPVYSDLYNAVKRPLLEVNKHWLNTYWKSAWMMTKTGGYPQRTYGQTVSVVSSGAGLLLNTNLGMNTASQAEINNAKEPLLVAMIQWGIDTYGWSMNNMQWQGSGGHQLGRLVPMFMAGKVLNNGQDILSRVKNGSGIQLQEYGVHYFVDQRMINTPRWDSVWNVAPKPYTQDMLGMPDVCTVDNIYDPGCTPDWGYEHTYRYVIGGPTTGAVATILLMNGRSDINHEALMRYYIERHYPGQRPTENRKYNYGNINDVQPFVRDLWETEICKSLNQTCQTLPSGGNTVTNPNTPPTVTTTPITGTIHSITATKNIEKGRTYNVNVNYTVSDNADLLVQLKKGDVTVYVDKRVTVGAGTNKNISISITIPDNVEINTPLNYFTFLTTTGANWGNQIGFAQITDIIASEGSLPVVATIHGISAPTVVEKGKTYTLNIEYSVSQVADLYVQLKQGDATVYTEKKVSLTPGNNKTVSLDIIIPDTIPLNTALNYLSYITPTGTNWDAQVATLGQTEVYAKASTVSGRICRQWN